MRRRSASVHQLQVRRPRPTWSAGTPRLVTWADVVTSGRRWSLAIGLRRPGDGLDLVLVDPPAAGAPRPALMPRLQAPPSRLGRVCLASPAAAFAPGSAGVTRPCLAKPVDKSRRWERPLDRGHAMRKDTTLLLRHLAVDQYPAGRPAGVRVMDDVENDRPLQRLDVDPP